eukprot:1564715-Lingulodinium_polyedra.AAC.1
MTKAVGREGQVDKNEMMLLRMDKSGQCSVEPRDRDVLTSAELTERTQEVRQAMLRELQTWAKCKNATRHPRRG